MMTMPAARMRRFLNRLFLAVLIPALALPALAQETIALSEQDIARLDIVFAPLRPSGEGAGAAFPATVVTPPDAVAAVSALYGGVLERWLVLPGEEVEAGSVLAHVRSPAVLDLQSEWRTASAAVEEARFELDKDRSLFEQGLVSGQRLNRAERNYERALIALRNAREKLGRAGLEVAEDAAAEQAFEPGLYLVRAPTAGVLTHRAEAAGAPVEAGTHLASLNVGGNPWVSALIPARLAQPLRAGQILGLAGDEASLVLRQKDFEVDAATQTVEILAEFEGPVDYLPGQILSVRLPSPGEGVLVPASAVVHSGDEITVYLRAPDGVEARTVELTPAGEAYLAAAGLRAGEQVVVQGAAVIKGIQLGLGGE